MYIAFQYYESENIYIEKIILNLYYQNNIICIYIIKVLFNYTLNVLQLHSF